MKTGKLIALLLCLAALLGALAAAEEAEAFVPQIEDFAGTYVGRSISFGDNIIPLGEDEYYSLVIEGEEALISEGIVTGTNGPGMMAIQLIYENGEMHWQPEGADIKVCTLRLLSDGTLTVTFNVNPNIPVFRFEKAEEEEVQESAAE